MYHNFSSIGMNSFYHRGVAVWNSLPQICVVLVALQMLRLHLKDCFDSTVFVSFVCYLLFVFAVVLFMFVCL